MQALSTALKKQDGAYLAWQEALYANQVASDVLKVNFTALEKACLDVGKLKEELASKGEL